MNVFPGVVGPSSPAAKKTRGDGTEADETQAICMDPQESATAASMEIGSDPAPHVGVAISPLMESPPRHISCTMPMVGMLPMSTIELPLPPYDRSRSPREAAGGAEDMDADMDTLLGALSSQDFVISQELTTHPNGTSVGVGARGNNMTPTTSMKAGMPTKSETTYAPSPLAKACSTPPPRASAVARPLLACQPLPSWTGASPLPFQSPVRAGILRAADATMECPTTGPGTTVTDSALSDADMAAWLLAGVGPVDDDEVFLGAHHGAGARATNGVDDLSASLSSSSRGPPRGPAMSVARDSLPGPFDGAVFDLPCRSVARVR